MQVFVKDIMQTEVTTVSCTSTVEQSETIMLNTYRPCVPVIDDQGDCVGVLSHSDILRIRNDKKDVSRTYVQEIMSRNVIAVGPRSSVDNTMQLMLDNGIHHILVLQDKKVCGIVSVTDIIQIDKARTYNPFADPEPHATTH
ncbi:MAG: CBS domain-containing protein [Gammaproteobacteria bacterium]|nr:CBS domain-containing protein [Gammaproteobacteria bacterium]